MSTLAYMAGTFVALVAIFAGYLFIIGFPPEVKAKLAEEATEKLGEDAASSFVKDKVDKLPEGDQKTFDDLKGGLAGLRGDS